MRDLMKPETMLTAVLGGLLTGGACVPFVAFMTVAPQLQTLRLAFLFPVTIVCWQVSAAWSHKVQTPTMWQWPLTTAQTRYAVTVGAVHTLFLWFAVDPALRMTLPGYFPRSMDAWTPALPWMVLFHSLVFVATPYAFAARLTRSPTLAFAAIVVTQQVVIAIQMGTTPPAGTRLALVSTAAVTGTFLALAYRTCGFAGPVIVTAAAHLRHLVHWTELVN